MKIEKSKKTRIVMKKVENSRTGLNCQPFQKQQHFYKLNPKNKRRKKKRSETSYQKTAPFQAIFSVNPQL